MFSRDRAGVLEVHDPRGRTAASVVSWKVKGLPYRTLFWGRMDLEQICWRIYDCLCWKSSSGTARREQQDEYEWYAEIWSEQWMER